MKSTSKSSCSPKAIFFATAIYFLGVLSAGPIFGKKSATLPASGVPVVPKTNAIALSPPSSGAAHPRTSSLLCRNFPEPRVAYCVAGALRNFYNPLVYKTIKDNLIDSFGGRPDVFLDLKMPEATGETPSDPDWQAKLKQATDYLQPVVFSQRTQKVAYDLNPKCLVKNKEKQVGMGKILQQYQGIKDCYELILKHENEKGFQYDWVARVRSDTIFYTGVLPYCAYEDKWYHPSLTWIDHFSMIPRKYSDNLFLGVVEDYYKCDGQIQHEFHDDWLVDRAEKHNVPREPFNFPLIISGSAHKGGAERFCNHTGWRYKPAHFLPVGERCSRIVHDE